MSLTGIAQDRVAQPLGLAERHSILAKRLWVGRKSEKSLLSEAAKEESRLCLTVEPLLRCSVVGMHVESQGEPKVNVGEKHLLAAALPLDPPSIAACPEIWNEPKEISPTSALRDVSPIPACKK